MLEVSVRITSAALYLISLLILIMQLQVATEIRGDRGTGIGNGRI